MKRIVTLLLAVLMLLALCPAALAEGEPPTRTFTDSVGRTVELPAAIDKVAVSGPLAQIVLFALCPDKLVGIASKWDATAEQYLKTEYYDLPVLGQLYGGKGELNLETLLASGAQVVIDVGEPKKTIAEDLDALQEQTGVPFVHVTALTATMGDAYRKLGELLDMADEAEALAAYCDRVYARTMEIAGSVEKKNLLYITGDQGLNVIAQGSYHAEVIDLLSNNLAVVESPSSKGTGNEVDMEQILLWNPDVILFAPGSIYSAYETLNNFASKQWEKTLAFLQGQFSLSRPDCEDVFQEAFIILHQKIMDGELDRMTASLATYFNSICRNKAFELMRKSGKTLNIIDEYPNATKDEFEDERIDKLLALEDNDEQVERRKSALVRQIVKDLPEQCNDILWGFYRDGFSMKTLANMLNYSSESSVKVIKHRCCNKFKDLYNSLVGRIFD